MNAPITEADIKLELKRYLQAMGWFVFHVHQHGYRAYKGISDYIIVKNGVTVYLEAKKPGGKQSPDQIKFEDDIVSHGGIYLCVDSLDKLIKQLQGHGLK